MKRTIFLTLIFAVTLSFFAFTSNTVIAEKGTLCTFKITVLQPGCSTPQSGASVTVTYYDSTTDTKTTDANGEVFFTCWGPTFSAAASYGKNCGFICTTSYSNGSMFNTCLGSCNNPCGD